MAERTVRLEETACPELACPELVEEVEAAPKPSKGRSPPPDPIDIVLRE